MHYSTETPTRGGRMIHSSETLPQQSENPVLALRREISYHAVPQLFWDVDILTKCGQP